MFTIKFTPKSEDYAKSLRAYSLKQWGILLLILLFIASSLCSLVSAIMMAAKLEPDTFI